MLKARQEVFDTYWKTAAERQEIYFNKIKGLQPFTNDKIFEKYKFCNTYRASDRVSQYLIKQVIYNSKVCKDSEAIFRIFLFRLINKIETWKKLEEKLGEISLNKYSLDRYSRVLVELKKTQPIYGNAFILCAHKSFGYEKKHENQLALLEKVFLKSTIHTDIFRAKTMREMYNTLRNLPLIGDFMAYQLSIDFNYSEVINFSENEFSAAGPGAIRGIEKCFENTDGKSHEYIIKQMAERQSKEFERLGIKFKDLWGRPMQAIDCQNWFCETDKYCRVKYPQLQSNRVKIKNNYVPNTERIEYFYPPKWKLKVT